MPIYKAVITTWCDTTDPTDGMQITPHFNDTGVGSDPQGLADDLLTRWTGFLGTAFKVTQRRVQLYNATSPPPNYPVAISEANMGAAVASNVNRDVAVCLSFYSDFNRPRRRGRLYIPCVLMGLSPTGGLVSGSILDKMITLPDVFAGLGGVDVSWGIYSKADSAFRKATHWWVDDSYDTQRRRGRRASTRRTGTTGS